MGLALALWSRSWYICLAGDGAGFRGYKALMYVLLVRPSVNWEACQRVGSGVKVTNNFWDIEEIMSHSL